MCQWYKYLLKKDKLSYKRGSSSSKRPRYLPSIHKLSKTDKKRLWQIDTFHLPTQKHYVLLSVETVSKKIIMRLIPNLKAETVTKNLQFLFCRIDIILGIIMDRGTENSFYKNIVQMLRSSVYFCAAAFLIGAMRVW